MPFSFPTIHYQNISLNFTHIQQDILDTAYLVAHAFESYTVQIQRCFKEYSVHFLQHDASSQIFALMAALIVGFILSRTSRRFYRQDRHQQGGYTMDQSSIITGGDPDNPSKLSSKDDSNATIRQLDGNCSIHDIAASKSARDSSSNHSDQEGVEESSESNDKMEQYIKEIEFLNSEISRLTSELEPLETLRDENTKLRRKCNQLLGEVAQLRKKLATASQFANNEEDIRNLEYQLLYGNTEKDQLIASLQKELFEKNKLLQEGSGRSAPSAEDSINKWLFEDCDTEYAL